MYKTPYYTAGYIFIHPQISKLLDPSIDMPSQSDSNQYALNDNGQLKDIKDIKWFNSPSDETSIPLSPVEEETVADGLDTVDYLITHGV